MKLKTLIFLHIENILNYYLSLLCLYLLLVRFHIKIMEQIILVITIENCEIPNATKMWFYINLGKGIRLVKIVNFTFLFHKAYNTCKK